MPVAMFPKGSMSKCVSASTGFFPSCFYIFGCELFDILLETQTTSAEGKMELTNRRAGAIQNKSLMENRDMSFKILHDEEHAIQNRGLVENKDKSILFMIIKLA